MLHITSGGSGVTPKIRESHELSTLEQRSGQGPAPHDASWLGRMAQSLKSTSSGILPDSLSQVPSVHTLSALAGHVVQQAITCGATTFAREEVFMHAYNAMLPAMEGKAKWALLGLQGAISLATIALNVNRDSRLYRLDEHSNSANVRGRFGLSLAQWQAKTPEEQQKLTRQHHTDSHNVTRNALVAEVGYMAMSALGHAKGDGALPARMLATQLRNLVYAATRETLQASISLTTSVNGKATHGVNDPHMSTMGWAYTCSTLVMSSLQDSVIGSALPDHQSVSGPALSNGQGQPLKGQDLTHAILVVALIRAVANTGVEVMDAMRGKHYDLKQVGDSQKFQSDPTKWFPTKDYERLLDHSPARLSWNNISNAGALLTSEGANLATQGKMPKDKAALLNNLVQAALFGLTYKQVNGTYGAHAANRGAVKAKASGQTQNLESGSGVPITMRPQDADQDRKAPKSTAPAATQTVDERDLLMSGALSSSSNFSSGPKRPSNNAAGPGPATQATRDARANRAVEPKPSASISPTPRSSVESRGDLMRSLIDSQQENDTSREAIKAGKQPQRQPTQSSPVTQPAASTSAGPAASGSAASSPQAQPTSPVSASAPQLPPVQPGSSFADEFAEILKSNT